MNEKKIKNFTEARLGFKNYNSKMIITKKIEEKDNQKLTKELQELKTRHKSFIEDYLKLKDKNKKLQEEIEGLKEENQKLKKRIDILHYVIKR